jgi:hypothetical protein
MNETTNIKRQFYDSLKRGTGEAYLIIKSNPSIDFSTYLIKGALKNFAYDGQSEGSRAKYIFDIISISNNQEKIRNAVLNGIATEQDDTWSLTHLFELVKLYAEQGDKDAKQTIYDRFLNNPIEGSDWVGYEEILELDGLKGLIYIAEKFGKLILQNPEDWQENSIIRHFQDDNPKIKVIIELEKIALTNKYVRIYLNNIERTKTSWGKHKTKPQKFNDIIDEVLNSKPFLSFRRRKELEDSELEKIAEQLLREKNKSNIEKLLNVFTNHKFPLDEEFLLKLAKQRASSGNRINEYAIDSLKFLNSKSIREFALGRIPRSKRPATFADILISNYQSGDYKLLSEIANKFNDEYIIESLASSYSDIFSSNKTIECKKPLEILYGKMNCGIHRNGIVKILIDNNVLSDTMREEIKYDSYLETRELVKENKKSR